MALRKARLWATTLCCLMLFRQAGAQDLYAQVKEISNHTVISQFEWTVPDAHALIHKSFLTLGHNLGGPEFYTGKPGYKVRLSLSLGRVNPNTGVPYLGVWFTLIQGKFDDALEWPFQYKFNLTVVSQNASDGDAHVSMNPMTAICRLRKQFQRPTERKSDSDGCGKAYLVAHDALPKFISNDKLLVRLTIFLEDKGAIPKRAKSYIRGHQLVSEFLWTVEDIDSKLVQARRQELHSLTSELFYINSESYLMILQLTFHPEDEYLGLFAILVPGEFDDSLEWPLTYNFELSIVDQSRGYLTSDRKGLIDPTSGICNLNAFTKPLFHPNMPCGFRRLVSFDALQKKNFKKDGKIIVRFTAILEQMPNFASVSVKDQHIVAEYTWKVPNIERKMALAKSGRPSNLLSERFYTGHQGYLMQMQLKFQNSSNGSIGLYLTLLEGDYDVFLQWPFVKRFDLLVIDQQHGGYGNDIVVSVDPNNPYIRNEACTGSFWRPYGRNDACGSATTISYDQVYSRKYIRYGDLLVKALVYMKEIPPPNIARLVFRDDAVVAEYDWLVRNVFAKIMQAKHSSLQYFDSDKFYLSNSGYRVMLRLYPEKAQGYVGLYVVLIRGAYDNVLEWPFRQKYELVLVDQSGAKADLVKVTEATSGEDGCPDIALKKPTHDLADWSCGESRMISHSALRNGRYVKDGTLRVRFRTYLKEYATEIASITLRNGTLATEYLWAIDHAYEKVQLLKTKQLSKLESPLFYTNQQGYALRVSVVLNPVTASLQTLASNDDQHVLGIYFTLWKGKHDVVLKWPFRHVLLLTLVHPTHTERELTKMVDPRNARCPSEAFNRPKTAHNQNACGYSAFLAVGQIHEFITDNVMVIKTTLDMRT
ncbi:uncharacterized protein LOC135383719 [Ornithodoros turicata]|uniref:uncharacterized protein LOC135383719 n=1 Tax=Ornithodoros turicata TaxID=34597 RepID=UPI00313A1AB5